MTNFDYLYNPTAAKAYFEKNYFVDKQLGYRTVENGMILPYRREGDDGKPKFVGYGGIVDNNGEFIKESYVHFGLGGKYTPPPNQLYTARKLSFISEFLYMFGDIA